MIAFLECFWIATLEDSRVMSGKASKGVFPKMETHGRIGRIHSSSWPFLYKVKNDNNTKVALSLKELVPTKSVTRNKLFWIRVGPET